MAPDSKGSGRVPKRIPKLEINYAWHKFYRKPATMFLRVKKRLADNDAYYTMLGLKKRQPSEKRVYSFGSPPPIIGIWKRHRL